MERYCGETNLTGVKNKLGAPCEAFCYNHKISERRAVVYNVAILIGDEWLFATALHNVDSLFVDGKPQVLRKSCCVRLLGTRKAKV